MSRHHFVPALLATLALAAPALAQEDTARKRDEGRYFVELSEIMFTPHGFDRIMADVDEDGGAGPLPQEVDIAEIDRGWFEAPRITIGLNRPSRKTTLYVSTFDVDTKAERIPSTIEKDGQVVTTPWLPPGIAFQRQRPDVFNGGDSLQDDYIPNWGEEYGYIRRFEYKSTVLGVQHNIFENKHFRLRWIAGLRHAAALEKTTLRVAYAPEGNPFGTETQDFLSVQSSVETHGIGPNMGLAFRELLGKKKKWSIDGRFEVAPIPESTSAKYGLALSDSSYEVDCDSPDPNTIICNLQTEHPAMSDLHLPSGASSDFSAFTVQQDFTALTWHAEAEIGIRFQPTDAFTIGLSWWGMTWTNMLSEAGVVNTIHRDAHFEQIIPSSTATDPALLDVEGVIHVPRFSKRQDMEADGLSLTMRFEF